MSISTERLVTLAVVTLAIGFLALAGVAKYEAGEIHRLETMDVTPDETTYQGQTYGSCDAGDQVQKGEHSPSDEPPSKTPDTQVWVKDWRTIVCPLLPGVKEPHPDSSPQITLGNGEAHSDVYNCIPASYLSVTGGSKQDQENLLSSLICSQGR